MTPSSQNAPERPAEHARGASTALSRAGADLRRGVRARTGPWRALCLTIGLAGHAMRSFGGAFPVTGLALVAVACQPPPAPEREVFDEAEDAYRAGNYDLALEKYEAFLKNAPDHQLAPIAQQRVLSIERELEVVMGRTNGPRPFYLRPVDDEIATEGGSTTSR